MYKSIKFLTIFSLLALAFGAVPPVPVSAFSGPGSGTGGDPYQIANCVQLQEMTDDLDAFYILVNDIDCSDTINWNGGEGFNPIAATFSGQLDGQSFTITDLYIDRPLESDVGLFKELTGTVTRVRLLTPIIRGSANVGGITGNTSSGADINQAMVVQADILGDQYVGGIAGLCSLCTVGDVMSSGDIDGDQRIGGIIGSLNSSAVTNAYSSATVTGDIQFIGGITGYIDNSSISSSYSSGTIANSGFGFVGGIVGGFNGGTINSIFAVGAISGGLASSVGAIVGDLIDGDVIDAYWDSNTTGQSDCAGSGSTNPCGGTSVTDPLYFNADQGNPPVDDFTGGGSFIGGRPVLPQLTSIHSFIAATIDPDLIAYWKLDDPIEGSGLLDSSGRGSYGTPQGASSGPVPEFAGKPDTGFTNPASHNFNGIDHYYNLIPNVDIRDSDFTIAFWANRSVNIDDDYVLTIEGGGDNTNLVVGFRGGNNFTCAFWNNDLDFSNYANELNNAWHHWACTYDAASNTRTIYLDGSAVATDTASADFQGFGPTTIAGFTGSGYYEGLLDDIRIYDEVLDIPVIAALANANNTPSISNLGPSALASAGWTNDTTPTFTFDTVDADSGDTVRYQIVIDNNSDFSSPFTDYTSALASPGSQSFTLGQAAGSGIYNTGTAGQTLSEGVEYFWRVRAIDDSAAASSYVVANFGGSGFRVDITPPSATGTPVGPSATNDTTPTITWNATSDSGSGIGNPTYDVQYDDNSGFSSPTSTFVLPTNFTPSSPLAEGTWYFRIRVPDGAGNEYMSGTKTIVIDTTNPTAPGSPSTSTPTSITKPTWTWTAGSDTNTFAYEFQWASDSGFSSPSTVTISANNFTHSVDLTPGTWYARVRTIDVAGNVSAYASAGSVMITGGSSSSSSSSSSGGTGGSGTTSQVTEVTSSPSEDQEDETIVQDPESYNLTLKIVQNGSPLAGVIVKLDSGQQGTTDSNGFVTFRNVAPGAHDVTLQHNGATSTLGISVSGKNQNIQTTIEAVFASEGTSWPTIALIACGLPLLLLIGFLLFRKKREGERY